MRAEEYSRLNLRASTLLRQSAAHTSFCLASAFFLLHPSFVSCINFSALLILSVPPILRKILEYGLYMVRSNISEAWDLAGFTDLRSRLGRIVPTGQLLTFRDIRLDKGEQHLLADYGESARVVRPTRDLLDDFVKLAEAPASAILQYARKWGLLFLDEQGRPCTKAHQTLPASAGMTLPRSEPLAAWRYYSRRARAVLNIAAHLQQGKCGHASDWAALDAVADRIGPVAMAEIERRGLLALYATVGCPQEPKASLASRRRFLAWELMLWLELTRPSLTLKANQDSWQMEIAYNGCLLAAIALQLALTVAGARTLFTCSGCGMAYIRARAAKSGQANFCPQCGPREALRQADYRRRRKAAEARRLHATGWSVGRIVKELKVRSTTRSDAATTVRRWIGIGH